MMTERVKHFCMLGVRHDLECLAESTKNIKDAHDASVYAAKSDALKGIVMDLYGEEP